ncbi:GSCOCG00003510001-RA-CDS [Cotesia congregata]|nr:GSCOCG00003510001-RA-CDS [Cotesia congregata]
MKPWLKIISNNIKMSVKKMNNLLIISTGICLFAQTVPVLIKSIISWMYAESPSEAAIKNEMQQLEQEMASISMVDEFAKYTRVQRRHTLLKKNYADGTMARVSTRNKIQIFLIYFAKLFNGIAVAVLLYFWRNEPVIVLPKGTLWPINSILSWPGIYNDSISLFMWMGITTFVMSKSFVS